MFVIVESDYEYMDCIWDGIEKGLYSLKNRKGNMKIKLRFGTNKDTAPKSSDTLIKVYRIMMQLKSSKLDDFMFTVRFQGNVDTEWKQQRRLFCNRHKKTFVKDR